VPEKILLDKWKFGESTNKLDMGVSILILRVLQVIDYEA
jgi:hypothetical protein